MDLADICGHIGQPPCAADKVGFMGGVMSFDAPLRWLIWSLLIPLLAGVPTLCPRSSAPAKEPVSGTPPGRTAVGLVALGRRERVGRQGSPLLGGRSSVLGVRRGVRCARPLVTCWRRVQGRLAPRRRLTPGTVLAPSRELTETVRAPRQTAMFARAAVFPLAERRHVHRGSPELMHCSDELIWDNRGPLARSQTAGAPDASSRCYRDGHHLPDDSYDVSLLETRQLVGRDADLLPDTHRDQLPPLDHSANGPFAYPKTPGHLLDRLIRCCLWIPHRVALFVEGSLGELRWSGSALAPRLVRRHAWRAHRTYDQSGRTPVPARQRTNETSLSASRAAPYGWARSDDLENCWPVRSSAVVPWIADASAWDTCLGVYFWPLAGELAAGDLTPQAADESDQPGASPPVRCCIFAVFLSSVSDHCPDPCYLSTGGQRGRMAAESWHGLLRRPHPAMAVSPERSRDRSLAGRWVTPVRCQFRNFSRRKWDRRASLSNVRS